MDLYCKRCGEPFDMDHVNFGMPSQTSEVVEHPKMF